MWTRADPKANPFLDPFRKGPGDRARVPNLRIFKVKFIWGRVGPLRYELWRVDYIFGVLTSFVATGCRFVNCFFVLGVFIFVQVILDIKPAKYLGEICCQFWHKYSVTCLMLK